MRLSLARAGAGFSQGEFPTPVKITSKPFLQLNSARCSPCTTLGTGTELRWQRGCPTVSGEGGSDPNHSGPLGWEAEAEPQPSTSLGSSAPDRQPVWTPRTALTRKGLQEFCPRSRSHSSGAATRASGVPPERSPPVPAPASGSGAAELPAPAGRETLPGPGGNPG